MKEIKGDLLKLAKEGLFDIIIHGCNTKRTFGAGIALQIAKYEYDTQEERYSSIRKILRNINKECRKMKIGLPLLGCGLAGGDWNIVKNIIEEELKDCDVTVVHYDK